MASLDSQIKKLVNNHINNYIEQVSMDCNISKDILKEIWKDVSSAKKNKKKCNNDIDDNERCIYMFTRGHKAGDRCDKKCRKNKKYCSQHRKYEDKNILLNDNPKQIIIKKNKKIDKYCHNETGMVFKSKDEKTVIGKLNEEDKVVSLTKEDILICKTWGFNFQT